MQINTSILHIFTCTYYMCVCLCVYTHTHTHARIYRDSHGREYFPRERNVVTLLPTLLYIFFSFDNIHISSRHRLQIEAAHSL